jgi:putative ABC transport system substrate-binding protein
MRRRDLMALLAGAATASTSITFAEQPTLPVIGFLGPGSPNTGGATANLAKFRQGLSEAGYVEGQNVAFEFRWAEAQNNRLPALAADLVDRNVDVIVTGSMPAIQAAMKATSTIPIVFVAGVDPVAAGLVSDLAHPDRNLTGFSVFGPRTNAKRLEILSAFVPNARVIGYMTNPTNPAAPKTAQEIGGNAYEMALANGMQLHLLFASTASEIDAVFLALAELKADGLIISVDPIWNHHRSQIVALAAQYRIPTIYYLRHYAEVGGLASYGRRDEEELRAAGFYAGRILAGAKPADLPIQMPTRYELVINRKAANALGLAVPLTLETQADEIIE